MNIFLIISLIICFCSNAETFKEKMENVERVSKLVCAVVSTAMQNRLTVPKLTKSNMEELKKLSSASRNAVDTAYLALLEQYTTNSNIADKNAFMNEYWIKCKNNPYIISKKLETLKSKNTRSDNFPVICNELITSNNSLYQLEHIIYLNESKKFLEKYEGSGDFVNSEIKIIDKMVDKLAQALQNLSNEDMTKLAKAVDEKEFTPEFFSMLKSTMARIKPIPSSTNNANCILVYETYSVFEKSAIIYNKFDMLSDIAQCNSEHEELRSDDGE